MSSRTSTTPRRTASSRRPSARGSVSGGAAAAAAGESGGGFAWDAAESALVQGMAASSSSSRQDGGRRQQRPLTPTTASTAASDNMWDSMAGALPMNLSQKSDKAALQEVEELKRKNAKLQKKVADAEVLGTKVDRLVEYFEDREQGFSQEIRGLEEAEAVAQGALERYATEYSDTKSKEAKAKRELRHLKGLEVREAEEWQRQLQDLSAKLHYSESELEAERSLPREGFEEVEAVAQGASERYATEYSDMKSKEAKAKRELLHLKGLEVREAEEWQRQLEDLSARLQYSESELEVERNLPRAGHFAASPSSGDHRLVEELQAELQALRSQPSPAQLQSAIELLKGRESAEERACREEALELEEARSELQDSRGLVANGQLERSRLRTECHALQRRLSELEELAELRRTSSETMRPEISMTAVAAEVKSTEWASRWMSLVCRMQQVQAARAHEDSIRQLTRRNATGGGSSSSSRAQAEEVGSPKASTGTGDPTVDLLRERVSAAERDAKAYAQLALGVQEAVMMDLQKRFRLSERWIRPESRLHSLQQELLVDAERHLRRSQTALNLDRDIASFR
mmetsp:Transcript_45361/g.107931  ORF Transcript_45361/g.107931 Transcript_45361/m.107931 type:complete len:575 (-) Transcript_45361:63-1787(-)